MGRHIYFRTPTWEDRRDIFDLYLARSTTRRSSTAAPARRARADHQRLLAGDDRPGLLDGAHLRARGGRDDFEWHDLVEAMTTSRRASPSASPTPSTRSGRSPIHEAGHAVCSHLYNENLLSTRLSIRKRGDSGGHHQAMRDRGPLRVVALRGGRQPHPHARRDGRRARLLRPEHDGRRRRRGVRDARACGMVGFAAMAPTPVDLSDRIEDVEEREEAEERDPGALRRARQPDHAPLRQRHDGRAAAVAVLSDPAKRRLVAELLGQAFVVAYATIVHNRAGDRVGRRRAGRRRASSTVTRWSRCWTPRGLAKPDDRRARRGDVARDLIPPALPRRPARPPDGGPPAARRPAQGAGRERRPDLAVRARRRRAAAAERATAPASALESPLPLALRPPPRRPRRPRRSRRSSSRRQRSPAARLAERRRAVVDWHPLVRRQVHRGGRDRRRTSRRSTA